jgi:crotonobetaine/carnitine-CoA ligase
MQMVALDKRMPPRETCVVRDMIDHHARTIPGNHFVYFSDGAGWTYEQLRKEVRDCAQGLQRLGVRQDDFVLSWLPNGATCLRVMLALNYLGAVYVPINTGYRGGLLEHVIDNSGASLMIADAGLVDRLEGIRHSNLRNVVVVGSGGAARVTALDLLQASALDGDGEALTPPEREIQPWDTLSVIYTSGTTGPSKGVLSSSLQVWSTFIPNNSMLPEDRTLVTLPMFHMGGAGPIWTTLMRAGSFALVESFRTQEFWAVVRRFKVTHCILLGAMTPFLLKEPLSPEDRNHGLKKVAMVPLSDQYQEFAERFGVTIMTSFNMTETSSPLFVVSPSVKGTCGKMRKGVELRVVDENDCEVEHGQIGELIIRTEMPWALNHGYHRNPEATAKAWRNGWFHTGDAFRRDADGNFFFVDRMKDAIRRRGENISSFEVEKEIVAHPDVRDAVVVAVPSEFGEDEVLAVLSPVPGRTVNLPALVEFLRPRLAHFMVPRFFRVMDDLPRTPTEKVQKHLLRSDGVTPDTWDRDKAGIVLRRERLTSN